MDIWEWLDGEYRIQDKIPSRHFIGIGFPSRSLNEEVQALKTLRKYSLYECLSHISSSEWYKDLCSIKSYMDYNDIELPIYSITSGKKMGNLFTAISQAFNINSDEVEEIYDRHIITSINQRVGTIRNLSNMTFPIIDTDENSPREKEQERIEKEREEKRKQKRREQAEM